MRKYLCQHKKFSSSISLQNASKEENNDEENIIIFYPYQKMILMEILMGGKSK
jgi:hypothetical protein